ncbi:retropepsin-like domain-containing protein [Sphingomonas sp. CFBP 13728]|nr:retropepsin-like domain-containing protein [Sphingomonas sp. CFBP 13728]
MKMLMMGALLAALPARPSQDRGPQTISLELFQGKQFTVQASVGGRERTFLFDTGEGVTMITPALARDLGCEPWGNVTAFRMTGERLDLPRCDDVAFEMGEHAYTAPTTIVYDLGKLDADTARLDGSIGLDLFAGRIITIRFASRQIVIETPGSLAARMKSGLEVPVRLVRGAEGAALDVNIGVNTPRGRAWMELDSANAGPTIFVSPQIAPHLGLRADIRTAQPVSATIRRDVVFTGQARVFPNMIMDGNIGMQLMGRRDLTVDLGSGRAWIGKAQ